MATPRRSVKKVRWTRGFIVAFLAFTAAILLTAKPVIASEMVTAKPGMANAWGLIIDVKDDGGKVKKMTIRVNETKDKVSATVDGKELEVSDKIPYPVEVGGKHTRKIGAIYPGPTIVFEGSTCVLIKNRWIGYPPGTICP